MADRRQEFIEEWPLFTKCDCPYFTPPDNISRQCRKCGKETTWRITHRVDLYQHLAITGYLARYECSLCERDPKDSLGVVVRVIKSAQSPYNIVQAQKIGEYPPPTIAIPPDVEKRLGADAVLYRNALVCRSQNFGIGAVAYLRRVVENQTNELIEVVALEAASHGVDPADIEKIRAAKQEKIPYEERLRLASEAIPGHLKPDGANPLAALYGFLSLGLHNMTDDECVEVADEIREVFEYVFSRLRAEIEDRNSVVAKIKKWVGRGQGS